MTELPEDWIIGPLGSILPIRYGKALPQELRDPLGVVPVVGSAGVMAHTLTPLVESPCIVVGRKGNVGQSWPMPHGCWPTDTTYYVAPPEGCDLVFLSYQLEFLDLRRLDSSTAVPSLRRQDLESQALVLPPLPEQRRIVATLEDHLAHLDAASGYVSHASQLLGIVRESLLDRLTSSTMPLVCLGSLATDSGYGTSTKCDYGAPGVPVVRIPNIVQGELNLTDEKRSCDTAVDLSKMMLEESDFLVVRTNGSKDLIGRTAVVGQGIHASFASYLIRYRFDLNYVDPSWVYLMMEHPRARGILENLAASSAGQYNLSLGKLNEVMIPLPDIKTQRQLTRNFDQTWQSINQLWSVFDDTTVATRALRRSLLAAAFRGDLTADWRADQRQCASSETVGPPCNDGCTREGGYHAN